MAQDAVAQPIASTSAAAGMEDLQEPQLTLPLLLDSVVESYESQKAQLADACRQIDSIIHSEENLTDLQRNDLRDRYTTRVEEVAARRVFATKQGQREGEVSGEVPPGEDGDETVEPP